MDAVVVDVVALSAGWAKLVSWQQILKRNAKSQTAQFLPWEPYNIMKSTRIWKTVKLI